MTGPVVHPLGITVLRSFLLAQPAVSALVGTRVSSKLEQNPTFPAVRLTEISANEVTARRWMRTLVQIDCWASRQVEADRLARTVMAALRDSANFSTPDAVMAESSDLSVRAQPDTSLNPAQPRAVISAHIWIRPNP